MPKFFFHFRERDTYVEDIEGSRCDTIEVARNEAIGTMRDIICDHLTAGTEVLLRRIEISDDTGTVVGTITLSDGLSGVIPVPREVAAFS
ncbi:Hypothetical protein NGAL_HAMBI2605_48820 [Neorhizobium galegae bv. orientalis]|nr:Hypothetical protein NGAL_HAMBI2605_48820 [Neorhizobium galegae bv. orientalis]